jgi:DNA anti-recombination protein RmuC
MHATKEDLDSAVAGAVTQLRGEIAETRQELRGEIAETRQELRTVEQNMLRHIAEVAEHTARVVEARIDARLADQEERLDARLEERLAAQEERLGAQLEERLGAQLEERLGAQLARHVMASEERNRELLRSLDDRYRAMPREVAALRRDLDAHVADDTRQAGPAPDAGD